MNQATALDILKIGTNVFLTGEPGSGKTHTINRYIDYLREHDVEPAVTASTGIAATHIGGYTIHSWSGIGAKTELSEWELEELTQKEQTVKRVNATNVLIIEEVSMLDARLLDTLDDVLRALRRSGQPFGGMQVVLVGDFFQLPPVSKGEHARFAFASRVWQETNPVVCYLNEQYRQEDPLFLGTLSALRHRDVRPKHIKQLQKQQVTPEQEIGVEVTKLYSHNADVDRINNEELEKLEGKAHTYEMSSEGRKNLVEGLKRGCLSPETLVLKEGAVVMFTKNDFEKGVVNGTIGKIVDLDSDHPIVRINDGSRIEVEEAEWTIEENGTVRARITQLPLRLAWAITVHKSQGMSMDSALIDLSKAFEYGQGYVALSRVRTLEGLYLIGFNERSLEVHPDVAYQDGRFRKRSQAAEKRFCQLNEEKLQEMHGKFLESIGGSRETKKPHERTKGARGMKGDSKRQTCELVYEKKYIAEIASARGLAQSTIFSHVEDLVFDGELEVRDIAYLWNETGHSEDDLEAVHKAFRELDTTKLTPVVKKLNKKFTYDEVRLARMLRDL